MRKCFVALSALAFANIAGATSAAEPLYGGWTYQTPSGCIMTIELRPDGSVRRTTGQLEYLTSATLIPEHGGWRLEEKLLSQNGLLSCRGEPGPLVVSHLKQPAFLVLRKWGLQYHPNGSAGPALNFVRRPERTTSAEGSPAAQE